MRIKLSPVRRDDRLELSRRGDVLTINGEAFDFGVLEEGDIMPHSAVTCDWLGNDLVTRTDGVLQITLLLPHGPAAPPETLDPAPLDVTSDGPITLPPYSAQEGAA